METLEFKATQLEPAELAAIVKVLEKRFAEIVEEDKPTVVLLDDLEVCLITSALENYREDMKDDDFDEVDQFEYDTTCRLYERFNKINKHCV